MTDRQKLIQLIGDLLLSPMDICREGKRGLLTAVCMADNLIKNGVTVQDRGHWEEWWPGIAVIMTGEEMLYRCSACDAKYPEVEGYNFCPHCGAIMDE